MIHFPSFYSITSYDYSREFCSCASDEESWVSDESAQKKYSLRDWAKTSIGNTQQQHAASSSLVPKNSLYAVEIEALSSWDAEPVRKRPVLWSPIALRFTVKVVR